MSTGRTKDNRKMPTWAQSSPDPLGRHAHLAKVPRRPRTSVSRPPRPDLAFTIALKTPTHP